MYRPGLNLHPTLHRVASWSALDVGAEGSAMAAVPTSEPAAPRKPRATHLLRTAVTAHIRKRFPGVMRPSTRKQGPSQGRRRPIRPRAGLRLRLALRAEKDVAFMLGVKPKQQPAKSHLKTCCS